MATNVVNRLSKKTNPRVLKGIVTPMRSVPSHIATPEYAITGQPYPRQNYVRIYNNNEIPKLKRAAEFARQILEYSLSLAVPGISTEEIDIKCHEEIIKHNIYPSPINYCGFPKAICTSVNEVVCHGIPDSRKLEDGDILSIDISVFVDGFHGDNCGTVIVGKSHDMNAKKLVDTTKYALDTAISKLGPGACLSSIGNTIEDIAISNGFRVVEDFVGHGTGTYLHMSPLVMHHKNNTKLSLRPGMVFTIEPILVEGNGRVHSWDDNWTIVTDDGSRGAQFEHEVLITEQGAEVITIYNK